VSAADRSPAGPWHRLGDFTMTARTLPIALLAMAIGVLASFVARGLMALIALFTHLFFFQRLSTAPVTPAAHHLGIAALAVPVLGGLIIGAMARFGSDRIRGHGIPEALESILLRGSRVEPRLALWKPLSAAISIGSGGPFGAEGPIIMTGGALGSLIAQAFHLTAAERKTLLVAGSAAGMAATFGTPLAATLLAVELLLFELKPRSLVPVALATAAAMATRSHLFPAPPLFPVPLHPATIDAAHLAGAAACGLAAGALSLAMTASVYLWEDWFLTRVRLHWMWWPALGGLVIGAGGLLAPDALGVGYDSIHALLCDERTARAILLLAAVKWAIWSFSLGSGTSGGVLAPLLMLGSALGALASPVLPPAGPGGWALITMGAVLGGTMRAPLTGVLFAAEVTHDWGALVPLTLAVMVAYALTVLAFKRSILTEKVARRGYHLTCEYEIDPLEILFVRDVIEPATADVARPQTSATPPELCAHLDDTLRAVAYRMAHAGVTRLPIYGDDGSFLGDVSLEDVLKARRRHLEQETRREGPIPLDKLTPLFLRR
jgi:H+/Cl- antiporter ClcA